MAHTIGYAGSGGPVLTASIHKRRWPHGGSFAVKLSPVIALRGERYWPERVSMGLLVQAPRPEGDGYVELVAEGYERQPILLEQFSQTVLRNPDAIAFWPKVDDAPEVSHVAMFGEDGSLCAYGALTPLQLGGGGVRFAAAAIQVHHRH